MTVDTGLNQPSPSRPSPWWLRIAGVFLCLGILTFVSNLQPTIEVWNRSDAPVPSSFYVIASPIDDSVNIRDAAGNPIEPFDRAAIFSIDEFDNDDCCEIYLADGLTLGFVPKDDLVYTAPDERRERLINRLNEEIAANGSFNMLLSVKVKQRDLGGGIGYVALTVNPERDPRAVYEASTSGPTAISAMSVKQYDEDCCFFFTLIWITCAAGFVICGIGQTCQAMRYGITQAKLQKSQQQNH